MQTYASGNGGFYDGRLECLSNPTECLPGYPSNAPQFLGENITRMETRYRYRFRFHPGAPADPEIIEERSASPTSVVTWAYTAEPDSKMWRQYCADDSGVVCYLPGYSVMKVVDSRCPAVCKPLN